jgi:hypothetical protein
MIMTTVAHYIYIIIWSWLQSPSTYISSHDHDYSRPLHIYHHMIMTTVTLYIYIITWSWLQSPPTYISSHDHDYSRPLHIYYHMIMTTVTLYIFIITWSWLQSPSTYISSHDHDYSHPLHIYYHMTYYEDYSCIWWLVDFLLWSTLLSCDHEDGNPHQLLGVCNSGRYT